MCSIAKVFNAYRRQLREENHVRERNIKALLDDPVLKEPTVVGNKGAILGLYLSEAIKKQSAIFIGTACLKMEDAKRILQVLDHVSLGKTVDADELEAVKKLVIDAISGHNRPMVY